MNEWELLLNQVDVIEAKKLFRINRDVRFSKDKTPYKSSFVVTTKDWEYTEEAAFTLT